MEYEDLVDGEVKKFLKTLNEEERKRFMVAAEIIYGDVHVAILMDSLEEEDIEDWEDVNDVIGLFIDLARNVPVVEDLRFFEWSSFYWYSDIERGDGSKKVTPNSILYSALVLRRRFPFADKIDMSPGEGELFWWLALSEHISTNISDPLDDLGMGVKEIMKIKNIRIRLLALEHFDVMETNIIEPGPTAASPLIARTKGEIEEMETFKWRTRHKEYKL